MTNRSILSRPSIATASVLTALTLAVAPVSSAFAAEPTVAPIAAVAQSNALQSTMRPASTTGPDVLASTPWETTGAVDQDGNDVALTDEAVANFVGWAYYNTNGTFTMYNLDDTPKMQGDWTVTPDGSERHLVAKDDNGEVLFERTVPITELTDEVFTYRVIPDEADPAVYYDIIHTPTDHAEPGAADTSTNTSADDELTETGSAGPIAAIAVGVLAVLGGAALFITRMVRRGRAS